MELNLNGQNLPPEDDNKNQKNETVDYEDLGREYDEVDETFDLMRQVY